MLNKLLDLIRRYDMLQPGDHVICAISGGADSVALLFALYLLREKLQITVSAAHFNHKLRGEESDADQEFVSGLCDRFDIPLKIGTGQVVSGKKGLEAAAREARYAFLRTLPGKVATAHTANDNAETVLMHLVRGTGLKGLGGIAPVGEQLIRPMLSVTRHEVLAFLEEYGLTYVNDSSNETDDFMRNRIRHLVMPLLEAENPRLAETLTASAFRFRKDEELLSSLAVDTDSLSVEKLKCMPAASRSRSIFNFLQKCGIPEPEAEHIAFVEKLVFSNNPSARASLPGGILIARNYDTLQKQQWAEKLESAILQNNSAVQLDALGVRICCRPASELCDTTTCFSVVPQGRIYVRSRLPGDKIRLSGGTKSLKKLFIDRKIPASQRDTIPVIADERGVIGVYGFGGNKERIMFAQDAVVICFESIGNA